MTSGFPSDRAGVDYSPRRSAAVRDLLLSDGVAGDPTVFALEWKKCPRNRPEP